MWAHFTLLFISGKTLEDGDFKYVRGRDNNSTTSATYTIPLIKNRPYVRLI